MFNFKSIRMKTMVILLPFTCVVLLTLTLVSYLVGKNTIYNEISQKMSNKLDASVLSLDEKLQNHSRVTESVAKVAQEAGTSLTKEQYKQILSDAAGLNLDTFGVGVWYEPYKYNNMKYFGPYAYKNGQETVYTEDYMLDSYDYPSQDYYKTTKTNNATYWTTPYYDKTLKSTFMTEAVPFYDSQKNFLGVVTGDVDLKSLQDDVSKIKVGTGGKAFLITSDGTYLGGVESSKLNSEKITSEKNSSLRTLGKLMLKNKNGTGSYESNGKQLVFYKSIQNTNWIIALTISEKELYKPVNDMLFLLIVVGVAATVVLAVIIALFSNYIKNHIGKVNQLSAYVSQGDLTHSIEVKAKDELGQMARNLNTMSNNLKDVVTNVSQSLENIVATAEELTASAEQTHSAAEQVAVSMQEVAEHSDKQSKIAEDTSDRILEISKNMEHITNSFNGVSKASVQASELADEGKKVVTKAKEQMNEIDEKVNQSTEAVNLLGKKSNEIGQIISIITSISEQTNLLALNAAIEAARAGEQGKGFAVVADEVRKLAEQSAGAAGRISSLIDEIQSEITEAVKTMNGGTAAVTQGKQMVENAGESFEEIYSSVEVVSEQVNGVSQIVNEIYKSSEMMEEYVKNISKISKESAGNTQNVAAASEEQTALMREVSNAAQSLTEMALTLQNLMAKFKL